MGLWHRVRTVRPSLWLLLAVVCSASACSKGCTSSRSAAASYSYLVLPSGRMFRVLRTTSAVNEENQKVGTLVSYVGEAPEPARIETDADALAAALAPEREAAGEKTLIIGANFGADPRRDSPTASQESVYNLVGGRWLRAPGDAAQAKGLEGLREAPPPEDALFPYEPKTVEAAGSAAANWLALLDAGAPEAALSAMTDSFRAQVGAAPGQWQQVLQRRTGLGQSRAELYRQQSRTSSMPTPPSGITAVQYLSRTPNGNRVLERVTLVCEATGCKVAGYTYHPIHGG